MKIKEINFFKRICLRVRAKAEYLRIPCVILKQKLKKSSFLLTKLRNLEEIDEINRQSLTIPLYRFDKPHCLYNWTEISDNEFGGSSTGEIFFEANSKSVFVQGNLNDENKHLLTTPMFFGLSLTLFAQVNLLPFNAIRVTLRSDGNFYKLLLRMSSDLDYDHHVYGFIVEQSQEWQTLDLPLALFLIEKEKLKENHKFLKDFMNNRKLKSLSFVAEAENQQKFQFQIKSFELIFRQEYEEIAELYQRPIFFRAENAETLSFKAINTGKDVLSLRNEQVPRKKTSVNSTLCEKTDKKAEEMQEIFSKIRKNN